MKEGHDSPAGTPGHRGEVSEWRAGGNDEVSGRSAGERSEVLGRWAGGRGGPASAAAPGPVARLLAFAGLVVLHLAGVAAANSWNATRPASALVDPSLPWDDRIPHLAWTAVLYYLGDVFILTVGGCLLWRLGCADFRRAVRAFAGVIVIGGLAHLLWPAVGPEAARPSGLQRFFDRSPVFGRYAALPSMHVALSTLPAAMACTLLRSRLAKDLIVLGATAIAVATLTAREHWILDAVTGALLGLAGWAYWRWGRRGDG